MAAISPVFTRRNRGVRRLSLMGCCKDITTLRGCQAYKLLCYAQPRLSCP
jgi:hypothetical protein